MGVFNKRNAIIGWAVIEGARLAGGRRGGGAEPAEDGEKPKKRRAGKALATVMGAAVAVGGVVAIRRRKVGPGTEE